MEGGKRRGTEGKETGGKKSRGMRRNQERGGHIVSDRWEVTSASLCHWVFIYLLIYLFQPGCSRPVSPRDNMTERTKIQIKTEI